ncbi:hypothetical protein D1Y84_17320 [Acidipila sp. EB88]|nr:hypothetical protein D1Y84_17320 [Acidipila sp. EB88]
MSACFYIVVEGEDPGYDIFVNGHALARHEAELEQLATALGVPPLLDFFSADRNSMAILLEQGAGDPAWSASLPDPQWFTPFEGLTTVRALLAYLQQHPASYGSSTGDLVGELQEYQQVLEKSSTRGGRWHLAVSWE